MLRHPAYYESNALITSFISEKLVELSGNSFQRKPLHHHYREFLFQVLGQIELAGALQEMPRQKNEERGQ